MEIQYTKTAIKQIKALDNNTRQRVIMGIEKIPLGDVKKLKGFSTAYRLRIGDYRVLFSFTNDIIIVTNVLPRGEAYKNL